jgi:hypothetical protein
MPTGVEPGILPPDRIGKSQLHEIGPTAVVDGVRVVAAGVPFADARRHTPSWPGEITPLLLADHAVTLTDTPPLEMVSA